MPSRSRWWLVLMTRSRIDSPTTALGNSGYCDTRSHVMSELVEEVWLMPET